MSITRPSYLQKRELHILIAEDQPAWFERIAKLAEPIEDWSFCRSGQFVLRVSNCRSVQEFVETADQSLSSGAMVYATFDLNMPTHFQDTVPDERAGERMITWCLKQRKGNPDVARRLEFCLISGMDGVLERIETTPQGEELKKYRVKRIHKRSIDDEGYGRLKLIDISADIKDFLRRNIQICSYLESAQGSNRRVPVWFGDRQPLVGLLAKADQIATATDPGVYLIFSDAADYEVDWVHLCCSMRNLRLTECDVRRTDSVADNWDWWLRDPPQALLVRNVEYANLRGCDLESLLINGDFFQRVRENKSLVFFQFPFFETQLGVSHRLDEEIEQPVLTSCLRHIYGEGPPFPPGIGFAFKSHRRIVTFPPYRVLKEQQVLRNTILLQAGQSSRQAGCEGVGIDYEVFTVLSEIDWTRNRGLQALRQIINSAYQNFAGRMNRGKVIGIDNFAGTSVEKHFHGELGLQVRGHIFYRLLDERTPLITPEELDSTVNDAEARKALAHLETLYRLYDGLDRLIHLRDEMGFVKTTENFSIQDFDALREAKRFLELLFETPQTLQLRIAEFRSNINHPNWRLFYPMLETLQSRAAVENIRFSWPFTRLHLHPAVHAYLKLNGFDPLIYRKSDEYMDRYPDLKSKWLRIEEKRTALQKQVLQRERQRRKAFEYVYYSQSRPVFLHLEHESNDGPWASLAELVNCFFRLEVFIAACEDYYLFGSLPGEHRHLLKDLFQEEGIGLGGRYLSAYIEALRREKQLNNSIFRNWSDEWAGTGDQSDAVRLARQLTKSITGVHRPLLGNSPDDLALVDKLANFAKVRRGSAVEAVLSLFHLAGRLYVNHGEVIAENLSDFKDLMRRFLMATNDSHRLGVIDTSGISIELWCKGPGSHIEAAKLLDHQNELAGRLVVVKENTAKSGSYEVCFPIDEFIRLRPERASLWALETPAIWRNVTLYPDTEEEQSLDPSEQSWLPDPQQMMASKLWRTIHEHQREEK